MYVTVNLEITPLTVTFFMKLVVLLTTLLAFQNVSATQFDIIAERAKDGDAFAQYRLGKRFEFGTGVTANTREAFKWYRKSAKQGLVFAQFTLGNQYKFGNGVPESDIKAVAWYRRAAKQGHIGAQFNLGTMYFNGDGIPENGVKAYVWWTMAKTQGRKGTKASIEVVKDKMTVNQEVKGQALAAQCYSSNYKNCSKLQPSN
jgi:TPR repeat protein